MRDFEHLTCPACGEPSNRPLRTFVVQPKWRCACGFSVMLPASQVKSMLARIELAKNIVRFGDSPE